MDETTEKVSPTDEKAKVLESPKPLAFTIDFDDKKPIDTQRFKSLVEKYQNRHRRGQSLSKIEEPSNSVAKKPPLTGNLPRKTAYHAEGYYSSDEKVEKFKTQGARSSVLNSVMLKTELTLPLKSIASDRMTHSYPSRSFDLPVIISPEFEVKDISTPELELMSPVSPLVTCDNIHTSKNVLTSKQSAQYSSCKGSVLSVEDSIQTTNSFSSDEYGVDKFVSCHEFEIDKCDSVSDAGTYTIEADNYSEEQKARMSIDKDFNIEQVSDIRKTQEYIQSLNLERKKPEPKQYPKARQSYASESSRNEKHHHTVMSRQKETHTQVAEQKSQMSLSQNITYAQTLQNNLECDQLNNVSNKNKVLHTNVKMQHVESAGQNLDKGVFTLVTTSGVLNKRPQKKGHARRHSLVKSEILVETYPGSTTVAGHGSLHEQSPNGLQRVLEPSNNVVQSIKQNFVAQKISKVESEYSDMHSVVTVSRITNLPPAVGGSSGKNSPTKIPSPLHSLKPRSRSSYCSQNYDLSDSSLETESYLKPTQNIISSLQARLSIDSDSENDYDKKYNLPLNNEAKILSKNKPVHVRNNSFDDRNIKMPNKLEHFHNKNLQGIDQTFKACNQYSQNKVHQIQNSPNNSPIRRSSSFSVKNKFDNQPKCLNTTPINKDNNYRSSPNAQGSSSIQRSSSTANIKPKIDQLRRASINSDNHVLDKSRYVETESSSEDDYDKTIVSKNKKDLTNMRYNRAFSLRRARLDLEPSTPKCPNTPEMRRKFTANEKAYERTVSVDRKATRSAEIPSRYLNISKAIKNPSPKPETPKTVVKCPPKPAPVKPSFSRTDSGRFSLRSPKPVSAGTSKPLRRDLQGKKPSGPRSNSTLSSREVEFQNWKRRKSYDPMKAAAEGKKKAELARKQNIMTQSYNENSQEYDSSPSHSSSVHRSQSFHGTAALEQNMISSEDEEDLTLSGDEGFSPPTPSPCELSPAKTNLRHNLWRDKFTSKN